MTAAEPGARPAVSRQAAVLLSLTLLAALFLLTGFMTRLFLHHEEALADEWYHKGQVELGAQHPDAAVEALHNALAYSKENLAYELKLAQALVAAHRDAEAEAYLRTLHESQPGNSLVDLELARLARKRGSAEEAVRFYMASLYGVWDANGEQRRRQTRLELIAFLTELNRKSEALAQIMSFAANLPPDPALHTAAGYLFLAQKSFDHAEQEFREALQLDASDPRALEGAARANFEDGKLSAALSYLNNARRVTPEDHSLDSMRELALAVLEQDPYGHGLSAEIRARRAVHAFELAAARHATCTAAHPPAGPPDDAARFFAEKKSKVKPEALRRDMDLFDEVVATAYAAELEDETRCGPGSVEDQALALLARRRTGGPR